MAAHVVGKPAKRVLVAERLNQRRQHGEARPGNAGVRERDPAAQAAFQ